MNVAILSLAFLFAGPVFSTRAKVMPRTGSKSPSPLSAAPSWPAEFPQRKDFFSKKH